MITDGEALLRAILENPAEDTPRLVYADWLEENPVTLQCPMCAPAEPDEGNDPHPADLVCLSCGGSGRLTSPVNERRAEFIRVQVELAKYIDLSLEPARALARRERELLSVHWRGWSCLAERYVSASYPTAVGNSAPDVAVDGVVQLFRRGFVAEVTCTAADWLAHADAITAAHPVERVRLTTWPEWDFNEYGAALKWRDRRDRLWGGDHSQREIALRLLAGEWPRIAFELPPAPVTRTAP